MCEFCKDFDFKTVGIAEMLGKKTVCLAIGSTTFPENEQFKYCPLCGEKIVVSDKK